MSAPPFINVKVDSGASANFHEINHHLPHQSTSSKNPSVSFIVPNEQIMTSNTTSNLPIPTLPPSATLSHGFPKLASGSLLSVGQICNHNCTAIFTDKSVKIYNTSDITVKQHKEPILAGTRNAPSQPLYNAYQYLKNPSHMQSTFSAPNQSMPLTFLTLTIESHFIMLLFFHR